MVGIISVIIAVLLITAVVQAFRAKIWGNQNIWV